MVSNKKNVRKLKKLCYVALTFNQSSVRAVAFLANTDYDRKSNLNVEQKQGSRQKVKLDTTRRLRRKAVAVLVVERKGTCCELSLSLSLSLSHRAAKL
jgi:hypothetical protein